MNRRTMHILALGATVAVLVLALAMGALAQSPTPTPTPTPEATPTATPEATPTPLPPTPSPTPVTDEAEEVEDDEAVATDEADLEEDEADDVDEEDLDEIGADEAELAEEEEAIEPAPLELTVYNADLGLVKEIRTLELEEGENIVRFSDVAARIVPSSVHVVSLTDPEGTVVLEQNYEYDLVNTQALLRRYIDRDISLTTVDGATYTGTLLSGAEDLILATPQGVRVVKLAQAREFAFPTLPEGLITRPSLVWLLSAREAGSQQVRVTYLTGGLNWRADYVALLAPDDASLSLTGWITLDNQSGTSYEEARLKLVAGDVHRAAEPEAALLRDTAMMEPTAAPQVVERELFEYHLYEVPRPVSVRDRQTKQIEFASAPEVAAEKVYVYAASPPAYGWRTGAITEPAYGFTGEQRVQVRLELVNEEAAGLGLPLPQGLVRVYKEDTAGGAEFVGEDWIAHTPRGESLSLYLGDAFDLVGERTQVRYRQLEERSAEERIAVTLRNRKQDEGVTVRVIETLFRSQDAEITDATKEFEMLDAQRARFDLEVPAGEEVRVEYTVVYRW